MAYLIYPTAEISQDAEIGKACHIWQHTQIRQGAKVGSNCILGYGLYIDVGVIIGNNCKIQNGCFVYRGVIIEDGVFLGLGVILTNDKYPRAINNHFELKTAGEWEVSPILIKRGASIDAGSIVVPGVTIGEFALVGRVDQAGHIIERSDLS